ncbi:hypothetical protein GTA08_BOTSDO04244 [Neofusicoccum parvum]|nr:hypothetical protein GTA08_BOTSDO04244 [Neofusicoccum parvum]
MATTAVARDPVSSQQTPQVSACAILNSSADHNAREDSESPPLPSNFQGTSAAIEASGYKLDMEDKMYLARVLQMEERGEAFPPTSPLSSPHPSQHGSSNDDDGSANNDDENDQSEDSSPIRRRRPSPHDSDPSSPSASVIGALETYPDNPSDSDYHDAGTTTSSSSSPSPTRTRPRPHTPTYTTPICGTSDFSLAHPLPTFTTGVPNPSGLVLRYTTNGLAGVHATRYPVAADRIDWGDATQIAALDAWVRRFLARRGCLRRARAIGWVEAEERTVAELVAEGWEGGALAREYNRWWAGREVWVREGGGWRVVTRPWRSVEAVVERAGMVVGEGEREGEGEGEAQVDEEV